ncbi:MAG: hypothetical protein QXD43_02755 [Candidatus Aenigmatarchaeota archaeon]
MKSYDFRINIDKTLRNIISDSLDLISYERGPDFRTRDFRYIIEMKSRRIENKNQDAHFSIKTKQYERFKKVAKQLVFSNNSDVVNPNLIFMFLDYETKVPVSQIPSEFHIKENLILDSSYLVDLKLLKPFETKNTWMNVTTKKLGEIINDFGIEPVVIKKLDLPAFPLGKCSKLFLKCYC